MTKICCALCLSGIVLFFSNALAEEPWKDPVGVSISVSEAFLQAHLSSTYHGQDVSTEKDQSFGFENVRLRLKNGQAQVKTDFWYKKFTSSAKEDTLIDTSGFMEVTFGTVYLPEKKRIMLSKGRVKRLKLKNQPFLQPILVPILETAIDRVVVWKKIDGLNLGSDLNIPVELAAIRFRNRGVLLQLNGSPPVPDELAQEMFAISVNEVSANAALEHLAPQIFAKVMESPQVQATLSGFLLRMPAAPVLDIHPGTQVAPGEMQLRVPLEFQPQSTSENQVATIGVKLLLRLHPQLHNRGKEVWISWGTDSQFEVEVESETSELSEWLDQTLQVYVEQVQEQIHQWEMRLPPIQFIPEGQALQLSQIILKEDMMNLTANLNADSNKDN